MTLTDRRSKFFLQSHRLTGVPNEGFYKLVYFLPLMSQQQLIRVETYWLLSDRRAPTQVGIRYEIVGTQKYR